MSIEGVTEAQALRRSSAFVSAKKNLLQVIADASAKVSGIRPSRSDQAREEYKKAIAEFQKDRGRDLYFPFLSAGLGHGPLVELEDGSVKYDMITGIGINFFGHSHPELMAEMVDALSQDTMQGNLQPGAEAKALVHEILKHVGKGSKLAHGWMLCSGTMSNEIALKIIRQKKFPATKIMAFRDCFAGRSTAMQEITDNPGYRQGQPVYGEVELLPFYDPALSLEKNIERTLGVMKDHLTRFPDKFAAVMMEPIQGEGGFNAAPREWYERVFEEAKKANLAVWLDEIQTFGRTGELFCYQKFGLNEYVDVVTVGKMLQACMVLYSADYNPKPGLVAGTFSGSTVALRTGRRTLEMLTQQGYLGTDGRIEKLAARYVANMKRIADGSCKGLVSDIRAHGGMLAFKPMSGKMDDIKAVLFKLFDLGVVAFYCGHGPYLIRMLPPFGVMTEAQLDEVCGLIEKAVLAVQADAKATAAAAVGVGK